MKANTNSVRQIPSAYLIVVLATCGLVASLLLLRSCLDLEGMSTSPQQQAIQNADAGTQATAVEVEAQGPVTISLPLIHYRLVGDIYEPDNIPEQAYGPLAADVIYRSFIWDDADANDYSYFTPTNSTQVQISLANIPPGCDYDLHLYVHQGGEYRWVATSNHSGSNPEWISVTPQYPNLSYYIRVQRYTGSSSQQPYHLSVHYQ